MVKDCVFFLQSNCIHKYNVLEYADKNYAAKEGWVRKMLTGLTKGGGGVGEMLTMAVEGGRGGLEPPPFLADIICEQPLISNTKRG